jgi:hypothetical protein
MIFLNTFPSSSFPKKGRMNLLYALSVKDKDTKGKFFSILIKFYFSYSFGFSVTPRFLKWYLNSTFFCFVTLGGRPVGFRKPDYDLFGK